MSLARAATSAVLSGWLSFAVVTASGCGTDAQGIDDCRDIEQARCDAAESCGIVDDVDACRRFYRDQCLHGLAVKPPANAVVERCVATIRRAGDCAKQGEGVLLSDCSVSASAPTLSRACDVVLMPEKTEECAFLSPDAQPMQTPDAGTPGDAGGEGGAGN